MTVRDCYRLLELPPGAPVTDIKRAYRRLARRYHPDSGHRSASAETFATLAQAYRALMERSGRPSATVPWSGSSSAAVAAPSPPPPAARSPQSPPPPAASPPPPREPAPAPNSATNSAPNSAPNSATNQAPGPASNPATNPAAQSNRYPSTARSTARSTVKPQVQVNPSLSPFEQELKENAFRRLQELFQGGRFPSAIALAEGLAQRLDRDEEVKQWLAIAYHRWGRELINRGQGSRAETYLKKALNTDPRNRQLWLLVDHELQRLSLRSG
ncbi:MAG: molecular chaperone DnaJ [Limnothrix sp. CACIAM 69d]|nr:MAG: molecular chaperone DnaJ [Limnothrix sp. CACIAM 69d]